MHKVKSSAPFGIYASFHGGLGTGQLDWFKILNILVVVFMVLSKYTC